MLRLPTHHNALHHGEFAHQIQLANFFALVPIDDLLPPFNLDFLLVYEENPFVFKGRMPGIGDASPVLDQEPRIDTQDRYPCCHLNDIGEGNGSTYITSLGSEVKLVEDDVSDRGEPGDEMQFIVFLYDRPVEAGQGLYAVSLLLGWLFHCSDNQLSENTVWPREALHGTVGSRDMYNACIGSVT